MSLREWQQRGWLRPHRSSRQEIAGLLAAADDDLRDCLSEGLSAVWRLNIAYNAALRAATAALAACGYRPARGESHHSRTIQSLAETLGWDGASIRQLNGFRKKRNLTTYDCGGLVSEGEAGEMLALARRLRADVEAWLRARHPELL